MRTGFTLLEVLVAVMIAATLLLSADVVFEQMANSRDGAAQATLRRDQAQNGAAVIRRLVRQIDVSPISATSVPHSFVGDSVQSRFTSWCIAPGDWERECTVSLHAVADSNGAALVANSSTGDSARIQVSGRTVVLQYLIDVANGGRWVNSWPMGPTVPLAVGIMSQSDTVILRVGVRG